MGFNVSRVTQARELLAARGISGLRVSTTVLLLSPVDSQRRYQGRLYTVV